MIDDSIDFSGFTGVIDFEHIERDTKDSKKDLIEIDYVSTSNEDSKTTAKITRKMDSKNELISIDVDMRTFEKNKIKRNQFIGKGIYV